MNSERTADIIWNHVSRAVMTTIVLVLVFHGTPALAETGHSFEKPYFAADYLLTRVNPSFAKDPDPLYSSRFIKVLVASSKTSFFIEKGRFNGFEYEFLSEYETFVNQVVDQYFRIKILFIPVALKDIFSFLEKGYGDIAATGLSFPEYPPSRQFSFSRPYIHDVRRIIVQKREGPRITSFNDLRDHPVYAHQESNSGTLYKEMTHAGFRQVHAGLQIKSSAAICFAIEDILKLVDSGVMQYALMDEHIVDAWNPVLSRNRGEKQPEVHSSGNITLAVRRENTKLLDSLNQFIEENRKGSHLGNILYNRYYRNSKWIKNPHLFHTMELFPRVFKVMKLYGEQYQLNPLLLLAVGYKESRLDQAITSPKGAVGIMQLMPGTAADPNVDIKNIYDLKSNIHAGVKYLYHLRTQYFDKPSISKEDQFFLTLAAYNAGPNRIMKMRRITQKNGGNPDKWFFNVEKTAAQMIGPEVVEYVADVYKYFIAYQLQADLVKNRNNINRNQPSQDIRCLFSMR